jgi:hypothetical protein
MNETGFSRAFRRRGSTLTYVLKNSALVISMRTYVFSPMQAICALELELTTQAGSTCNPIHSSGTSFSNGTR